MVNTTNVVSVYHLDENAANTTVADSAGSNTGTSSTNTNNLSTSGKLGTAFNFNGTNENVKIGTMGTFGSKADTSSVSFWVKTTSSVSGFAFGFRNNTTNQIYYCGMNTNQTQGTASGKINMTIRDADSKLLQGALTTADATWRNGNWHFITITVDGANDTIVITIDNSSKAISYNATGTPIGFDNFITYDMAIGSRNDNGTGSKWFAGDIDELIFWDKILTAQDKTDLYNSGSGLAYPFTTGTKTQINIGDDWKAIDAMQINIGDTWKAVAGAQVNIGDSWKDIF